MEASSSGWTVERWIAVFATIIAIGSLFLNVVLFYSSRSQQRLAAQPHFQMTFLWDDTGMGWITSNTGTGSARIRGFSILIDGKPQPYNQTYILIGNTLGLNFKGATADFRNMRAGVLLDPGHSDHFFWAEKGPTEDKLSTDWTRVTFRTCYCSIYDQCWIASNTVGKEGKDPEDDNCSVFNDEPASPWWNG